MSGDYFDGLREGDKARVEWAEAARRFERVVWRVHDEGWRTDLERRWRSLLLKPRARVDEIEELIEDALNEIWLAWPLTPEEAHTAYEGDMEAYWADFREWQREESARVEAYMEEGEKVA